MTREYTIDPPPPRWQRLLGTAAAALLGVVLLVAAWAKAIDPLAFVEQIRLEGLDFFGLAGPVAFTALALEVGLGLALVLGLRRLWILVPATLLVAFFLFLTGRTYWRFANGLLDASESCGCFGNLVQRTPAEAFWQDLALLGLPAALMFLGRSRPARPAAARVAAVVAVTVAALLFAAKAPDLPLDDLATRLKPGVEIGDLCAGDRDDPEHVCLDAIVTELEQGRHLVVISNLEEEALLGRLEALNEQAVSGDGGLPWLLTAAPEEAVDAFRWTQAPAFQIREAPQALLRPLYRTLPRSFLVEDGRVVRTFSGLPELHSAPTPTAS